MTISRRFARFRDALEFARHVPPAQIARRIRLAVRRRVSDRFPRWNAPLELETPRAIDPPLPIFPPRRHLASFDGEFVTFCFIGAEATVSAKRFDWRLCAKTSSEQLWRMNLHYMEYLEGLPVDLSLELMASWLAHNPVTRRGAWRDAWNSYAVSLRVVVWMQQLAVHGVLLALEQRRALDLGLARQVRFLEANLETDIGGNHLVKNVKALLWASAYFAGDEALRWRRGGLALLEEVLATQVLSDGAHYELSPSYHCQVFADLLEIRSLLGANAVGGRLDMALQSMAQFAADMSHPDGAVAEFNDAGLTMAYAPAQCLSVQANLCGTAPKPRRHFAFTRAGYFGYRTDSLYLVADFGRLAPDDLPAHGHGDIGSFELSVGAARVFVDQGVFEYVSGDLRHRSRTAASHNTLFIKGGDQASFFGAFRIGRRPNVFLRKLRTSDDGIVVEGAHDGYAMLAGAPVHVRRFEVEPYRIVIADRIEQVSTEGVGLSFLLHPHARVEVVGATAEIFVGERRIVMTAPAQIDIEGAVWWPDMGIEVTTRRLYIALPAGCVDVVTKFEFSTIN